MASAAPGEQGELYRIRGHNRSVCIALSGDKSTSDVVVIKGSEPLLPDFERYLDWMQFKSFGAWPRPMMEHFPLFEGKTPGIVALDEARKETELALDIQTAHLRHYGELIRLPVPLMVLAVPQATRDRVMAQLRRRMSAPALERVEPTLQRGIGMFVYHYPGPPVRVTAVGRPRHMWPGSPDMASRKNVMEKMIPGWIQIAARLLWLGFLPSTPLAWRLGAIFDPNNSCLDGGACDIASVYPIADANHDAFVMRSLAEIVGALRVVIARAFGIQLPELAQSYEQDFMMFSLGQWVKREVERALVDEGRETLTLDRRISEVLGGDKSLPELMTIFQQVLLLPDGRRLRLGCSPVTDSPADEPWLVSLAAAVSAGEAVDWPAARARASGDEAAVVDELYRLSQIVRGRGAAGADAAARQNGSAEGAWPAVRSWRTLLVLEPLASGLSGDVHRAWDTQLDREVAVKFLHPLADGTAPSLREARALARVRHPNVVTVYGAEHDSGQSGLWMELIDGETLAEAVLARGPMSPREAAGIGIDVCRAVSALHAHGLVHRDVKAANVMREVGGRIVLMDFSGAHGIDDAHPPTLQGTPIYMAPEVLAGGRATPASDIYAIGVLLFFLLTGRHPVEGETLADLEAAHARHQRLRLLDARPDLPEALVRVVERAIAAAQDARFHTVGELEHALGAIFGAGPSGRPRLALPGRGSPQSLLASIGLAAALLALLARRRGPRVAWRPGPADGHRGRAVADRVRHRRAGAAAPRPDVQRRAGLARWPRRRLHGLGQRHPAALPPRHRLAHHLPHRRQRRRGDAVLVGRQPLRRLPRQRPDQAGRHRPAGRS